MDNDIKTFTDSVNSDLGNSLAMASVANTQTTTNGWTHILFWGAIILIGVIIVFYLIKFYWKNIFPSVAAIDVSKAVTSPPTPPPPPPSSSSQKQQDPKQSLYKTLDESSPEKEVKPQGYNEDDSTSAIQSPNHKMGWCFIGEDRGTRTCAKVSESDTCMSGNIYPSQEICINPTLRP